MKTLLFLIAMAFAAAPQATNACSIRATTVAENVHSSTLVVLAHPVSISYLPKSAASQGFTGVFTQTVVWEVLLSWKGGLKSGEKFTTSIKVPATPIPCFHPPVVSSDEAWLVLADGHEPFSSFQRRSPQYAPQFFKFLSKIPAR